MSEDKNLATDMLIIGCGIAGASAALEAAKSGLRVIVITKNSSLEESNTCGTRCLHSKGMWS